MITRILESRIRERINKGRAIIVFGARQVGKTTLLRNMLKDSDALCLNGDDADVRMLFSDATSTRLRAIIGTKKIVFVDEAQRIPDIGIVLKLIIDNNPDIQVYATGSSVLPLGLPISSTNHLLAGSTRCRCSRSRLPSFPIIMGFWKKSVCLSIALSTAVILLS